MDEMPEQIKQEGGEVHEQQRQSEQQPESAVAGAVAGSPPDLENPVTVIESLCPNCENTGETRLLLTRIPFFKEIVISSFYCPTCNYHNSDLQPVADIAEKGQRIELTVKNAADLARQVVQSEHATVAVPCLVLEIPPQGQKGVISTVEGILVHAADNLEHHQPVRRATDPAVADKIQEVVDGLRLRASGNQDAFPFDFVIDDPAGSSFIENPNAPNTDPQIKSTAYERTREQTETMGFFAEQGDCEEKVGADLPKELRTEKGAVWDLSRPLDEDCDAGSKTTFAVECNRCGKMGEQNMCETDIPGFRRCLIMAFVCDHCGARSTEVKTGGAIGASGRKWTLKIEEPEDLTRDVLKSDVSGIEIPELDMILEPGTLGGVFTTVEGLLIKIADEIDAKFPFVGDSTTLDKKARLMKITARLREVAAGRDFPLTLIIDDPADHSHIGRRGADVLFLTGQAAQSKKELSKEQEDAVAASQKPDPNLRSQIYERDYAHNELLGLNDIRVTDYEEPKGN